MIENLAGKKVEVVPVLPPGDNEVYTILPPGEKPDPSAGRISVDSPLAKALLTADSGGMVSFTIGREPHKREVRYRIIAVFE